MEHLTAAWAKTALALDLVPSGNPMRGTMVWEARAQQPLEGHGSLAGYVKYEEIGGKAYIRMIEVNPGYRGMGVARFLLDQMFKTWGREDVVPGKFTPDGARMWAAITGEDTRPSTRAIVPPNRDWRYAGLTTEAMPVGPPPSGIRYLVTGNHPKSLAKSYVMLGAFLGDEMIGYMTWGLQGRKVQSVWVKPEYRRRRVAEGMLQRAKSVDPGVTHHLDRTDEGDAWARAISPDAPPRENNTTEGDYVGPKADGRLIKQRLLSDDPRDAHRIHDVTEFGRAAYRLNTYVPDVADYYVEFKAKGGYDEATYRCYAASEMLRRYVKDERFSKERAEELIRNVLDDYGQGNRIMFVVTDHVAENPHELGSYIRTPGGNHVLRISSRRAFTILHEIAHALDPNSGHGQTFNVLYMELLEKYHRRGFEASMEYGNELYLLANAIRAGKTEPGYRR